MNVEFALQELQLQVTNYMLEQQKNSLVGRFVTKKELEDMDFNFNMFQYTGVDRNNFPDLIWKVTFSMAYTYVERIEKYMVINLDDNKFLKLERISLN